MSQSTIDDAAKLSVTYETVVFPELCTFGIHTTRRLSTNWSPLITVMSQFLIDLEDILCPVEGRTIAYSEWDTTGFTGWHQRMSFDDSANTYGSGDEMPHQVQTVGTYVNDTEDEISIGRRRNRSYIGPVNAGTIDNSDGRMGDSLVLIAIAAWENLDTALRGVDGDVSTPLNGLCVVSEAEGVVMDATRVKIGKKYDIHRSRAQKTPESYSATVIPVP